MRGGGAQVSSCPSTTLRAQPSIRRLRKLACVVPFPVVSDGEDQVASPSHQNAARLPKKPAGRTMSVISVAATETICDHSIEIVKAMIVSE